MVSYCYGQIICTSDKTIARATKTKTTIPIVILNS